MGSMRVFVIVFLLLASIVATATEAAVSCQSVWENFYPCTPYVMMGGAIPDSCCSGMRTIKGLGDNNPSDRPDVCGCINYVLKQLRPEFSQIVSSLPGACGVHLQYKFDPSTDCNRV